MTVPSRSDPETADHIVGFQSDQLNAQKVYIGMAYDFDTHVRVEEKTLSSRSQGGKCCQGNLTIGTKCGGIDTVPKSCPLTSEGT